MQTPKSWEVAAKLEDAAKAVTAASQALDTACSIILAYGRTDASPDWREWEAIEGTQHVHTDMAKALQALSDKYQAVADAEVEA